MFGMNRKAQNSNAQAQNNIVGAINVFIEKLNTPGLSLDRTDRTQFAARLNQLPENHPLRVQYAEYM